MLSLSAARASSSTGRKAMPTAYWPTGGQLEVGDRAQEGVRDLRDDAGAVTGSRIRADGAAVLEVPQGVEREGR